MASSYPLRAVVYDVDTDHIRAVNPNECVPWRNCPTEVLLDMIPHSIKKLTEYYNYICCKLTELECGTYDCNCPSVPGEE